MSDNTVQQASGLTRDKSKYPAGTAYDRWSVTGEAGKVVYDVLGNHLALIPTLGEIDSVMGRTLARVREYAGLNDDDAVFAVLADLYRTDLAAAPEPTNPDRFCRRCGATSGLRLTFADSPLALSYKQYECIDGCADGAS